LHPFAAGKAPEFSQKIKEKQSVARFLPGWHIACIGIDNNIGIRSAGRL
jgi:hypothetical protein